jgi:phage terminase Nu1 subunit (DNA packaging protein)
MSVTGIPVEQREPYRTRAQMADLMGVSVKTIDRWVAVGMPSETWGLRSRRFLASRALAWAREQEHRDAGD